MKVKNKMGKKRGRPSKAEVFEREQAKIKEENSLKEELKAAGTATVPLFSIGDQVKMVIVNTLGTRIKKGIVVRQDVGSPGFVLVNWDDVDKQWAPAGRLEFVPKELKKIKKTKKS